MTDTKKYTGGEKFANVLTHLLGTLIAIYAIVILVENSKNVLQAVSTAVYGGTLFLLFLSSTCYHWVANEKVIRVCQKIDHSAIYMLIAGTYTPILMLTVKFPLNVILVAMIWALAIVGIVFYCITDKSKSKSKKFATGLYLFMGWLSVFFFYNVWVASHLSVWLLLIGGLFYSLGCAFYLMKTRYMHAVWHLFVIAGAVMHYFAILELLKVVN